MKNTETVKDMLESHADIGLNPFNFATNFKSDLFKEEDLKIIFDNPDSDLSRQLFKLVEKTIGRTYDTQDTYNTKVNAGQLRSRFKLGKTSNESMDSKENKGTINKDNKDMPVQWNIYSTGDNDTAGQHKDRWQFIHFLLKYKIIFPGIYIFHKLFGKKLRLNIAETPYNENLLLFNTAFEDAIRDWNLLYLRGLPNPYTAGKTDEWWAKRIKDWANNKMLRTMKDLVLAVVQTDTAYREFFNLLIHNIGRHGAMHYQRVKDGGNGKTRHLFYSSGFAEDVRYYHTYQLLRDPGRVKMVEVGNVTINREGDIKNE